MIIACNIIGFAAAIFVLFKIYKHFEISYSSVVDSSRFKLDYMENLIRGVEKKIEEVEERVGIWREEELEERIYILLYSTQLRQEISLWVGSHWRLC